MSEASLSEYRRKTMLRCSSASAQTRVPRTVHLVSIFVSWSPLCNSSSRVWHCVPFRVAPTLTQRCCRIALNAASKDLNIVLIEYRDRRWRLLRRSLGHCRRSRCEPAQVLILMRSRQITSICEQGVGADVGCHRLTFHYRNRRFRLVIDGAGQIVRRSSVDFGQRARPGSEAPAKRW